MCICSLPMKTAKWRVDFSFLSTPLTLAPLSRSKESMHIKMAVVGSMEGNLHSTVTNVKVTKIRDEDIYEGGGGRE